MMSGEAKVADDVSPPDPWPPGEQGPDAGDAGTDPVRLTAWVRGRVQGVGFRWWVRSRALELGLVGWARNLEDGRVEVVAEGPQAGCNALLALLDGAGSPDRPGRPGRIDSVVERWSESRGLAQIDGAGCAER